MGDTMTDHQARELVASGRWVGNAYEAWRWHSRVGDVDEAEAIYRVFGEAIRMGQAVARAARARKASGRTVGK